MAKKSLKDVKINNTAQVLKCILKQEQISRIEIAERTNLSPSTVTQAVSHLLEKGVIEEVRTGKSTGGRKPILLEICPECGRIITVEVKRNGIMAESYELDGSCNTREILCGYMLTGNRLLDAIAAFVEKNKKFAAEKNTKIIGIGLLCQDDIPAYDLMTEFSTSLSSDLIRLDIALATRCNVPVRMELLNRYSLDFYLKAEDASCEDYAYVNIGERITASFVIHKTPVQSPNGQIFDISDAVLNGNYADRKERRKSSHDFSQEIDLNKIPTEKIADKLIGVIKSALLFFPVRDIFIGGQIDGLDLLVKQISEAFTLHPVIRKTEGIGENISRIFARQILMENYKKLIEVY